MCKGADSIIAERLSVESKESVVFNNTQSYVDFFADEGLRTLFLATKQLNQVEYNDWNARSKRAKLAITNREEEVAKVDEEIETNMTLIGSTAIEDRLQDDVADTIRFMKRAGIKVWVLTGDKIETAINIGVSAGLLDQNMEQHIIENSSEADLLKELSKVK